MDSKGLPQWTINLVLVASSLTACATPQARPTLTGGPDPGVGGFTDPFAYCAAVGTIDTPDAGYAGPEVPEAIVEGLRKEAGIADDAPTEWIVEGTVWRCMDGEIWACFVGANLPCTTKADVSRTPAPAMADFCRENPGSDFIPANVTGRETIYEWRCTDGASEIVKEAFKPDAQGFQSDFWYQISPAGAAQTTLPTTQVEPQPETPTPESMAVPSTKLEPTGIPTLWPTNTSPPPTHTLAPPPTANHCSVLPAGGFLTIWRGNPDLQTSLGCPTAYHPRVVPDAWEVKTAYQSFERGAMIWSDRIGWYDQPVVYVLYADFTYQRFEDSFDLAVDPVSGGEAAPDGWGEPMYGFGKVWRDEPGVRQSLGWALSNETPGVGRFQLFSGGDMIWISQTDQTYVFTENLVRSFDIPFSEE